MLHNTSYAGLGTPVSRSHQCSMVGRPAIANDAAVRRSMDVSSESLLPRAMIAEVCESAHVYDPTAEKLS